MTTSRARKPKTRPLRYFFYRGDLHKKIHINRGADVVDAWNYPKGELRQYVYSDVRRTGGQAFTTSQVSKMIQRSQKTIKEAITNGNVRRPQVTYGLDENRNEYAFYWSESDIMDLHAYFTTVHRGRPRKDGRVTPGGLPSAAELRAMLKHGTVFYVKGEDGAFVPTWQATKF